MKEVLGRLQEMNIAQARTAVVRGPWQARHKFNAIRVERDGRKFSSKAEASYHGWLQQEQAAGRLVFFLWQVPLHVPGHPGVIRLVLDFLEFWADGTITFTDVKGMQTEAFKLKRRQVQAAYPISIRTAKMLKSGPRFEENA